MLNEEIILSCDLHFVILFLRVSVLLTYFSHEKVQTIFNKKQTYITNVKLTNRNEL
jgi:hypothetical protein